jgi:molybdopterin-synthase adenylyltransferase
MNVLKAMGAECEVLDQEQTLRYARQIILKEFGAKGQEKLLQSKVLVIGAGGLGSPALFYLAAAGVGTIGIVDFDTVTISNLQRQVLYCNGDLGRKKVDAAEEKLNRLNPDMKIIKYSYRVNAGNIEDVIREYDVVLDCVDNLPIRYLINDCCYFLKKPLIEGASAGFEGILMTILPGQSPCYRCLYPEPPKDGVLPTCSDTGILGPVVGTIGTLQALEAIKVLLGIGKTLSGRILTFDGLGMEPRTVNWTKRPQCPLCGENPTIHELDEYEIKCKIKNVE